MCLNSDWTPQAWWSPMGLHRHVGLRWGMSVSDGAYWSQMKHVEVSDNNNIFVNSQSSLTGQYKKCVQTTVRFQVYSVVYVDQFLFKPTLLGVFYYKSFQGSALSFWFLLKIATISFMYCVVQLRILCVLCFWDRVVQVYQAYIYSSAQYTYCVPGL